MMTSNWRDNETLYKRAEEIGFRPADEAEHNIDKILRRTAKQMRETTKAKKENKKNEVH